jgi:hypothetical protein
MIEFELLETSGSKKIYFFAGNLVIGSSVKNFISGVYEKEVINKTSAMELLKEIEDFVKVKVREKHPLQVLSFQVTTLSIIGEVEDDKGEQKKS